MVVHDDDFLVLVILAQNRFEPSLEDLASFVIRNDYADTSRVRIPTSARVHHLLTLAGFEPPMAEDSAEVTCDCRTWAGAHMTITQQSGNQEIEVPGDTDRARPEKLKIEIKGGSKQKKSGVLPVE